MVYVRVHAGLHQGAEVEMGDSFTIEAAGDFSDSTSDKAVLSIIDAGGPLKLSFTQVDRQWRCGSTKDFKLLLCNNQGQPMDYGALSFPCFVAAGNNLFSLVEDNSTPFVVPAMVSEFFEAAALLAGKAEHDEHKATVVTQKHVQAASGILRPVNALAFLGLAVVLGVGALGALFVPQEAMTNEISDPRPAPVRVVQANVSMYDVTSNAPTLDPAQKEAAAKSWILSRLERVGLSRVIQARSATNSLHLTGELSTRQIQAFEKVLLDFERQNHDIEFSASIRELKPALPFKIKEMSVGANGWIVTDSGAQVFVGGEHKGYRLSALSNKRIQFTGPDSIELSF